MSEDGSHNIRIPGLILDELKNKNQVEDERFSKFNNANNKRKRPFFPKIGRKEKRKQERLAKKQKNNKNTDSFQSGNKNANYQPVAKRASYDHKNGKNSTANVKKVPKSKKSEKHSELPFSSDDELDSDDFDDIDDELDSDEREQLRELENNEEDSTSENDSSNSNSDSGSDEETAEHTEMTVDETMKALAAIKKQKTNNTKTSTKNLNAIASSSGEESDSSDYVDSEQDAVSEGDFDEEDQDEDEDHEMTVEETMAKLKALKQKKQADASSSGEESDSSDYVDSEQDAVSEGDFDEEDQDEDEDHEMTVEETMAKLKALKQKKQADASSSGEESDSSDYVDSEQDAVSEGDFDEEDQDEDEDHEMTVEETMAKLKALKQNKLNKKSVHFEDEANVESNHSSESESDLNYLDENQDSVNSSDIDESDNSQSETELSVEETMAALRALKEKKSNSTESMNPKKEKIIKHREKKSTEEGVYAAPVLTPQERAMLEKDEMDMQYYAKKLGLKGKHKKIKAKDEYDAIGGLLDGLDFIDNYGEDDLDYGEYAVNKKKVESDESDYSDNDSEADTSGEDEEEEEEGERDSSNQNPYSSDDEIDSDDFDEFDENDLNEEEWRQLRELEGYGPEDMGGESDEESDEEPKKKKKNRKKENPYVAPATAEQDDESSAYIPPSLRKKQAFAAEDANSVEIKKKIRIALNKLSESNVSNIVSTLSELYNSYPRQLVSDIFVEQTVDLVSLDNKVLDSFVMNYSAVTFCLWKLKGVEMGATFVQKVVEQFLFDFRKDLNQYKQAQGRMEASNGEENDGPIISSKKASNLITLLAYCYNFGMISCRLIYDIIDLMTATPNEYTTEILLRIISVSGPMIRGDDPLALKNSLTNLLNSLKIVKTQSSRMNFLLDTVSDLKNNRLKTSILAPSQTLLKKSVVSALRLSGSGDPIQVSLSDIENVDERGKWWLVGASWKGKDDSAFQNDPLNTLEDMDVVDMEIEDDFLDDIPDWGKIAKDQRMNTDLRRSIFVSIMSAQDFMDAFTKLEKLNLKNKQSLEIPRVILHCATMDDNGFNPYYSVLSCKLSEYNHNVIKGLQFQFWNIIKRFESDKSSSYGLDEEMDSELENDYDDQQVYGEDESVRLKRISAQGQFFGHLIGNGSLKFDMFKHVPLIGGLNSDGTFFIELLLYQALIMIGKKSEIKLEKKHYDYKDTLLRNIFIKGVKSENQSAILKSFQWFITKKFKPLKLIQHTKNSKEYKKEERRLIWALEALKKMIKSELDTIE